MTVDTTYLEMYCANAEVNKFIAEYPSDEYPIVNKILNIERLDNFKKRNAVYLNLLYERTRKIYENHVEQLENGDWAMKNTIVDDNGTPVNKVEPKYKDEQHEAQFKEDWNKLMSSHCQMTI